MYMTGFASVTTEGAGCIALFFSEWALDTVKLRFSDSIYIYVCFLTQLRCRQW